MEDLSSKYGQIFPDHTKNSAIYAFKSASKKGNLKNSRKR